MERTKIVVLATVIAVLTAMVLVGVAFAQTTAPTQTPYGNNYASNGYGCPGLNDYVNGAPQNGYVGQYGGCGRCGMIGGYYR